MRAIYVKCIGRGCTAHGEATKAGELPHAPIARIDLPKGWTSASEGPVVIFRCPQHEHVMPKPGRGSA